MYRPKVSIVIPAYNASNYLAEAIDSALAQTYTDTEIIVVNDGSNDNAATREVALSYGNKIKYFEKENGGSSSALNMGISHMTGEWFSWLSHDDLYKPEKLEKQIENINKLNLDATTVYKHIFFTAYELIDQDGKCIRYCNSKSEQKTKEKVDSLPHNGYLIAEPTAYIFHGCSCLIHKDALSYVGGFSENLRLLNDVDLWYRLYSADFRVHYIPEPLVKGRIHSKQVSRSIGYSYHNPEQDMFWNRSLDYLLTNYSGNKKLLFLYAKNAFQKTRNAEGNRAFDNIKQNWTKKALIKMICTIQGYGRNCFKKIFLLFNRD